MIALEYEFDDIHDQASNIPYWQSALWEREFSLQKDHWFLVDAWYRSRCLELPRFGPSMVPCIDMVNHSANPNAYYDDSSVIADSAMSGVVLLPRPGHPLAASDEITISYTGHGGGGTAARLEYTNGDDSDVHGVKSASEMLFSYGFVDPQSARHSLVLPFRPFPDDPLAKAKLHVFGGPTPRLEIERLRSATSTDGGDESDENSVLGADNGSSVDSDAAATKIPAAREARVRWSCPFSYLMCVNEEDGIDFRLRQETDGSTQLRMFWQNEDATEQARDFAALTQKHPLASVFQLRVVTVLQEAIESHLERMQAAGGQQESSEARGPEHDDTEMAEDAAGASAQDHPDSSSDEDSNVRSFVARQAGLLRDIESRVLSSALEALEAEVSSIWAESLPASLPENPTPKALGVVFLCLPSSRKALFFSSPLKTRIIPPGRARCRTSRFESAWGRPSHPVCFLALSPALLRTPLVAWPLLAPSSKRVCWGFGTASSQNATSQPCFPILCLGLLPHWSNSPHHPGRHCHPAFASPTSALASTVASARHGLRTPSHQSSCDGSVSCPVVEELHRCCRTRRSERCENKERTSRRGGGAGGWKPKWAVCNGVGVLCASAYYRRCEALETGGQAANGYRCRSVTAPLFPVLLWRLARGLLRFTTSLRRAGAWVGVTASY